MTQAIASIERQDDDDDGNRIGDDGDDYSDDNYDPFDNSGGGETITTLQSPLSSIAAPSPTVSTLTAAENSRSAIDFNNDDDNNNNNNEGNATLCCEQSEDNSVNNDDDIAATINNPIDNTAAAVAVAMNNMENSYRDATLALKKAYHRQYANGGNGSATAATEIGEAMPNDDDDDTTTASDAYHRKLASSLLERAYKEKTTNCDLSDYYWVGRLM
jgi:hypothetical protein